MADEVRPRLAAGRRIGTGAACPPSQSLTQIGETLTAEVSTRKARWALRLCGPSWTAGQVKRGGGGARATAGGQTWGSENEGDELIRDTVRKAMDMSVSCSVHASGELSCLCMCEAGKGPEELTFPPPLASLPSPPQSSRRTSSAHSDSPVRTRLSPPSFLPMVTYSSVALSVRAEKKRRFGGQMVVGCQVPCGTQKRVPPPAPFHRSPSLLFSSSHGLAQNSFRSSVMTPSPSLIAPTC